MKFVPVARYFSVFKLKHQLALQITVIAAGNNQRITDLAGLFQKCLRMSADNYIKLAGCFGIFLIRIVSAVRKQYQTIMRRTDFFYGFF